MPDYYRLIGSFDEIVGSTGLLRLPKYIREEFVFDESRRTALQEIIESLQRGKNVLIVGVAGVGKTALMAIAISRLLSLGFKVGYILEGTTRILRDHTNDGIILFYDDIPRMNKSALRSIVTNNVGMILATAREEELHELNKKLGVIAEQVFVIVRIEKMRDESLQKILERYAWREGIEVMPDATRIIVKKAMNLPVYIWQVIRDAKIQGRNILTTDFARKIPAGMLNFVDSILWRVLDRHHDRYALLLTLLIMSDMPKYEVNIDLLNAIFAESLSIIRSENVPIAKAVLNTLYGKILMYIAKIDPYTYKLPHDAWGDVLRGRGSGLMSAEISRINTLFPYRKRLEIVGKAINRAQKAITPHVESGREKAFREFVERLEKLGILKKPTLEKPTRKRGAETPWRKTEKLTMVLDHTDTRYMYPDMASYAKETPLFKGIVNNPVLWYVLGLSKKEIEERVEIKVRGVGVDIVYPRSDMLTIRHRLNPKPATTYEEDTEIIMKQKKLEHLSATYSIIGLLLLILFFVSLSLLDNTESRLLLLTVLSLFFISMIFLLAGGYYSDRAEEIKRLPKRRKRSWLLLVEELEVKGDPKIVDDFIRYLKENIDRELLSRIAEDKAFQEAIRSIGMRPREIINMWETNTDQIQ